MLDMKTKTTNEKIPEQYTGIGRVISGVGVRNGFSGGGGGEAGSG